MEIAIRRFQEFHVLDVTGELDLYNAFRLKDAVEKMIARNVQFFIVNVRGVRFIDSSGVAALLSIRALLSAMGRELRIVNLPRNVQRVLELTRLLAFLPISASEIDAIESIEKKLGAAAGRN